MKQNQITTPWGQTTAQENSRQLLAGLSTSNNPKALVTTIQPHDFLVTWRMADDEQRADLLRLADKEQAAMLVDLTCWPSDKPDILELETLIGPLVESSLGGAIYTLDTLEPELRTLLLKSNVQVHLLEDRNEEIIVPDESELIVCPDGRYHVEFPDPDRVTNVERTLWNALLMRPFEEYQPELECVRHEFPSELQEMALRWRNGRLADFGFASRKEAMSLLVPVSSREVEKLAEIADSQTHPLPTEISLPILYSENLAGNAFLDAVLAMLRTSKDQALRSRADMLRAELASMVNLYLTATDADLSDLDAVARGSRWARDLLTLGLYETTKGDVGKGAHCLNVLTPSTFLQVGLGLVYPLRDRARALLGDLKLATRGRPGAIFDPPLYIGLTCLARDIPCYWLPLEKKQGLLSSLFEPRPDELVAFSNTEHIAAAERILEECESLGTLLFDGLKCEQPLLKETPASILVLTALANSVNSWDLEPRPLTFLEARAFGDQVLALEKEKFLADALSVLAPLVGTSQKGALTLKDEPDPARRLLLRLILIGHSRLLSDAPERVVLTQGV